MCGEHLPSMFLARMIAPSNENVVMNMATNMARKGYTWEQHTIEVLFCQRIQPENKNNQNR